jgi:hypothetical protein
MLNYHYYNGYALLHWRIDQDVAPGGYATYLNPAMHALHYLAMTHMPPWTFGAIFGAVHGINTVLVWAIARCTLGADRPIWALAAALAAATGQSALSLLGTTFGDNFVSIPVLLGLLLLIDRDRPGAYRHLVAGLAVGIAVGLKLTMVVSVAGLACVVVWLALDSRSLKGAVAFVVGAAAGWGVIDGWWAFALWRRFGSPTFPLSAGTSLSSHLFPLSLEHLRRQLAALFGGIRPPFDLAWGWTDRYGENPFRDARFLAASIGIALLLVAHAWRRGSTLEGKGPLVRLVAFWLATYAAWAYLLRYYRYATPLEMLAPVLALAALLALWPSARTWVAVVCIGALLASTKVTDWGRMPWHDHWFWVRLPPMAQQARQMVLMEEYGMSFAIPSFPPDSRFMNLLHQGPPLLDELIAKQVASHEGPFLIFFKRGQAAPDLRRFGLAIAGDCEEMRTGRGRMFICPLARMAPSPPRSFASPT